MKILLSAMPRTASKWLCKNLQLYLAAKCCISTGLYLKDKWNTKWPVTDFFTVSGNNLYFDKHISVNKINFELTDQKFPIYQELAHRLALLQNWNIPIAIKIHPVVWYEILAIYALYPTVDRHYTLRRRDIFEQCTSVMACRHTNMWAASDSLITEIEKLKNNPYSIDQQSFKFQYESTLKILKGLDNFEDTYHLYYEDIIQIQNASEFCTVLNLPYINFNMDSSYGIEYGNTKKEIIKNYEQLRIRFNGSSS